MQPANLVVIADHFTERAGGRPHADVCLACQRLRPMPRASSSTSPPHGLGTEKLMYLFGHWFSLWRRLERRQVRSPGSHSHPAGPALLMHLALARPWQPPAWQPGCPQARGPRPRSRPRRCHSEAVLTATMSHRHGFAGRLPVRARGIGRLDRATTAHPAGTRPAGRIIPIGRRRLTQLDARLFINEPLYSGGKDVPAPASVPGMAGTGSPGRTDRGRSARAGLEPAVQWRHPVR